MKALCDFFPPSDFIFFNCHWSIRILSLSCIPLGSTQQDFGLQCWAGGVLAPRSSYPGKLQQLLQECPGISIIPPAQLHRDAQTGPRSREQRVGQGLGWVWLAGQSSSWVTGMDAAERSCRSNWHLNHCMPGRWKSPLKQWQKKEQSS